MNALMRARQIRPALPNPITALAAYGLYELLSRVQQQQTFVRPPQWLTLHEASLHSGLSVALLRRLITLKKLPAIKDGSIKVRLVDLEQLDNVAEMAEAGRKLAGLTHEIRRARRPKGWARIEAPRPAGTWESAELAAQFIAQHSGDVTAAQLLTSIPMLSYAYRKAAAKLHPDNQQTGSHESFVKLQAALERIQEAQFQRSGTHGQ